jgi:hypothetical protein
MPFKYASLQARLLANSKPLRCHDVDPEQSWTELPCRVWTGTLAGTSGYAKVVVRGRRRDKRTGHRKLKTHAAHRLALALHLGVPIWLLNHVTHHCDNKPCIEPTHLWSTSQLRNMRAMLERGRHRNGTTGRLPRSKRDVRNTDLTP